ncbi:MAG: T9SS type A sorting domain-containing protein [Crocinitomicaceae bacterium]|nr:T9SS type A sorting domain-containing protein [Crocinitomicaceae bacterium]
MIKTIQRILSVIFILSCTNSNSQVLYENLYQDSGAYAGYSIQPTSDNGYILSGFSNPTETIFGQDVLLMKIDSLGEVVFCKNLGDSDSDYGNVAIETYDGGYLVAGRMASFSTSSNDFYYAKTDFNGNLEWEHTFGGTDGDAVEDVLQSPIDSSYYFIGRYGGYLAIFNTDQLGDTLWTKVYQDTGSFYSIDFASDNTLILSGTNYSSSIYKGFVAKTDLNGNIIWTAEFSGGGYEYFYDCEERADGTIVAVGYSLEDSPPPHTDGIIRYIDASGNLLSYETFGEGLTDGFKSLCLTDDGGQVTAGIKYYPSDPSNQSQVYVVKTDSTGNLIWETDFGQDLPETENGWSICKGTDGGYVVCGQKTEPGESYVYVIKLNESGSVVSMNEVQTSDQLNVYPNPFTVKTTIQFSKPLKEQSNILVYGLSGEIIFQDVLEVGTEKYILRKEHLTAGIYIISVQSSQAILTRKIIIN